MAVTKSEHGLSHSNESLAVTGTFYQETQPVSIATMPTTTVTGTIEIQQDVNDDANNSSSTNLASMAVFTGTATSSLGIAGIQVSLKADQNCVVYVEQAPSNALVNGKGTVSANNSTTLTGSGTKFQSYFKKGDTIVFDPSGTNQTRVVSSVPSDTSLTVTSAFTGGSITGAVYQHYPWDISDQFEYKANESFGVTVQAISSYLRVKVKNAGASTTEVFRLQTALCPVVESLPRTLDKFGNLKTSSPVDEYGWKSEHTALGELRTIVPTRLIGTHLGNGSIDARFWTAAPLADGGDGCIVTATGNYTQIASGTGAASVATLYSNRRARYVGGAGMRYRAVITLSDTGVANNKRRWGVGYGSTMPTITDGAWFQVSGTTFAVVTCAGGAVNEQVVTTFNGTIGTGFQKLDTSFHTYEIYWSNAKVYFSVDGELLHSVAATTTDWSDTLSMHAFADSTNTGVLGASVNIRLRSSTIYRLGQLTTQPTSYYHASGTTTGVQLKIGAGNLHSIVFGGAANNAIVTLSDSTSGATPAIWVYTATGALAAPVSIDFKGLPFFSGLRLIVGTGNASCTIIYE